MLGASEVQDGALPDLRQDDHRFAQDRAHRGRGGPPRPARRPARPGQLVDLGCVQFLCQVQDPDLPYGEEIRLLRIDEIENAPVIAGRPRSARAKGAAPLYKSPDGLMLRVIEGGKRG
jgi:hypothetical protein